MGVCKHHVAGTGKPPAALGSTVRKQARVAVAARAAHGVHADTRVQRLQPCYAAGSDSWKNMQGVASSSLYHTFETSSVQCSSGSGSESSSSRSPEGYEHVSMARRAVLSALAAAAAAGGSLPPFPLLSPPAAAAAVSVQTGTPATECKLQTSTSGLRWCDLRVGQGPAAIKGAFIKTHHTAALASNGQVFDSSYSKKQPLIWKAGEREVMEAWDKGLLGEEGLPAMCEGGVRRLVVPPGPLQRQGTKSLTWVVGLLDALEESGEAVGVNGSPTTDLVFDIELLAKKRK